jgi:hypothetical protein
MYVAQKKFNFKFIFDIEILNKFDKLARDKQRQAACVIFFLTYRIHLRD